MARYGRAAGVLAPVAIAVATRLPVATSRAPLGYDDGVYLASVLAMRDARAPFHDVYSSQGPAFLPLLWLGDLLAGRVSWGARLVPVAAAAALVVIVHRLARLVADERTAVAAALLVATSGCLWFSTSRIESDAVAAAFGAAALLAAAGRRTIGVAVLAGLALAVKSLLVVPVVAAAAWLLWRRRGWRAAAAALGGAAAVVVALALPWGLGAVWEQFVELHLEARTDLDPLASLGDAWSDLVTRDRLVVAAVAGAIVAAVVRRHPTSDRDLDRALLIWVVGSVVVIAAHTPLFLQHMTHLVAPLAVVVARYRPPLLPVAAAALLLLPSHASGAQWHPDPEEPTPGEAAIVTVLRRIEPADAWVITDELALPWLAGRASPGTLVDPSHVRIDAGLLDTGTVVAEAARPEVCAVLLWSGRLDGLPGLVGSLPRYRLAYEDGERRLYLRDDCVSDAPAPAPPP